MSRKTLPRTLVSFAIFRQSKWIESCGGDLAGYVARYGTKGQEGCYGDGGEAIYAADVAELKRLEGINRKYL